jgi:membrane protease YdiL (CAAX protease family)
MQLEFDGGPRDISEPVLPVETPVPAPERKPFWGYIDIALFVGVAVAFLILLSLPVFFLLRKQFILLAMGLQLALYAAIYLSLYTVFTTRYERPVFRSLGWVKVPFNLGWSVLWGLSLTAVVALVIFVLRAPEVPSPVDELVTSRASLIGVGIVAALVAPVFEELLFRGFLQPVLSRSLGTAAGIVITAALFGALHVPEYSNAWQYGVAITVVGIAFGYARARTGSLLPSTVMHASFNTVSVIGLIYTKFPTLK